jgi:hypothetical protein
MSTIGDAGVEVEGIPLVVDPSRGRRAPSLELAQGALYVLASAWPLVAPRSLGPRAGRESGPWLFKSAGALMAVIGGVLVYSGIRGRRPSEMALLGIGAAATLAAIDVASVAKGRLPRAYLISAAGQLALAGVWVLGRGRLPWRRARRGRGADETPAAEDRPATIEETAQ